MSLQTHSSKKSGVISSSCEIVLKTGNYVVHSIPDIHIKDIQHIF